jgi:hypothetical protein
VSSNPTTATEAVKYTGRRRCVGISVYSNEGGNLKCADDDGGASVAGGFAPCDPTWFAKWFSKRHKE